MLSSERRIRLVTLLREGASLRAASEAVGVAMSCAATYRRMIKAGACRCGRAPDHPGRCLGFNPASFRPVDPALAAEALRLRIDQDLKTPDIARRLGLREGVVYKILKGHPRRDRSDRLAHLDLWTVAELETVRRLWPRAPRAEVTAALPNRTWETIQDRARRLGVRRDPDANFTVPENVDPIFRLLRRTRIERNLSAADVAERCGAGLARRGERSKRSNAQIIIGCEIGNRDCSLRQLRQWCAALGLRVGLPDTVEPGEVVPARTHVAAPHPATVMAPPLVSAPAAVVSEPAAVRVSPLAAARQPAPPAAAARTQPSWPAQHQFPRRAARSETVSPNRRAEEDAIAAFLAKRGATRLPSSREMEAIDPVNPVKWDRTKKKFTRAPVPVDGLGPY